MKKLKFLHDVNVGTSVRRFLKEKRLNVESVVDLDPRMEDEDILRHALGKKQVLITCDKDFGDLIFNRGLSHAGVIRLEDTTPKKEIA